MLVSVTERMMWTLTQCLLAAVSTLLLVIDVNANYEGDPCNHNAKGVSGICRRLDQCASAIQDLKQGVYPQNCGFDGTAVIVCCTGAGTTTTTTTTTTPKPTISSTIKTPTGHLPVGEKSKQACQNYKILAYKKELSPTLDNENADEYELVENCPWEDDGTVVIYDGTECKEKEFPHMALIGYGSYPDNYGWKCGGSLVSDKFVLTAAHCMYARGLGEPKFVRLGDLDHANSSDDAHVQQINIKNRIKHPSYKSPVQYHDIALLELEHPATLNLYVKPVCLYTLDPAGRRPSGIVTGWGGTERGVPSTKLLKGVIKYFTAETCNVTFGNDIRTLPRGIDAEIQICYGPYENQTDTCQGDSGGPIQIYNREVFCSYYLFGITSFGKGCGHTRIPAGYVNLYPYIEWIEGIVWP